MTGPASSRSSRCPPPKPVIVPAPVSSNHAITPSATGPRTRPSAVRLAVAVSGTVLLISPYRPKDTARVRASQGGRPPSTAMTTTATAAMPTATHCTGRSRSRSTSTPSSTLTNGLTKYPSAASTTCPVNTA